MADDQLGLDFFSESAISQTQSGNDLQFLRTSPVCSPTTEAWTLHSWLESWLGATSTFQTEAGKTPVSRLGQKGLSSGAYWTRNISEFRSGAVVSSLSEILETGEVDRRYFLSPRACAGILRRAEKRGKELPSALRMALEIVAGRTASTLNTHFGDKMGLEDQHALNGAPLFVPEYTNAMTAHNGSSTQAVAFAENQRAEVVETDTVGLKVGGGKPGQGYPAIREGLAVRRLTCLECERLQGFPDQYTNIPGASDTARYKALGNSFAVPVVRWIGERIERTTTHSR